MDHLLEHITDREVDDKIGRTVDDKEEVTDTDKKRDPDGTLTASTGVKEGYIGAQVFREIKNQPASKYHCQMRY